MILLLQRTEAKAQMLCIPLRKRFFLTEFHGKHGESTEAKCIFSVISVFSVRDIFVAVRTRN
jgi:hypothetical protein